MKHRPVKTPAAAGILLAIYLLGLALGTLVVCYLVGAGKRPGLEFVTRNMAESYAESGEIDPSPISGRAAMVYDSAGQTAAVFQSGGHPIYFDFEARGRRYLASVLAGREALRLVLFAPDDTTLGYTSLFYFGIPLDDGGALLWVRELPDLLETLLAFLCTFTAVFAVVTAFVLQSLRSQQRYDRLRRQYIDNITHELKTPVASIKALAEALSDGMEKDSADRSVYYGMILREANRQERMICDVLELSRLQNVPVRVARQTVSAAACFAPVLDKYAAYCDLMGIELTVEPDLSALPELHTDPKHIGTVLNALLSNAVKFVPAQGRITVSARVRRRRAVFCVEDNGAGIAREELSRVFERFYKGSRSDNETGSGLGLAIAREAADGLREKLWIDSAPGRGTRAYFTVALR